MKMCRYLFLFYLSAIGVVNALPIPQNYDEEEHRDAINITTLTTKRTMLAEKITTTKETTTTKDMENDSPLSNIFFNITDIINSNNEEGDIACLQSQQCPSGQQCLSGFCHLTCQHSNSCLSGQSCINSECVNSCRNEEVCGVNAHCINHKMVTHCSCIPGFIGIPTPKEGCVRNQHSCAIIPCPVGYNCDESNQCHYQCQESEDCAVGERCLNRRCAKICSGDEHCLIGEICTLDLVCETGCNGFENCHENQLCVNTECVTIGRENVEKDGVTRYSNKPTTVTFITTTQKINAVNSNEETVYGSGVYEEHNTGLELDDRDHDCRHIRNEKERITCKVISCFKHRDNCFK